MKFRLAVKIIKGKTRLSLNWFHVAKARQTVNGKKGWLILPMTQEDFKRVNDFPPHITKGG